MAYRVDATVDPVEAAGTQSPPDGVIAHAERGQLRSGHHAVLANGQGYDGVFARVLVEFLADYRG